MWEDKVFYWKRNNVSWWDRTEYDYFNVRAFSVKKEIYESRGLVSFEDGKFDKVT